MTLRMKDSQERKRFGIGQHPNSHPRGPANPQWKGGRSIASNGYVLIRVGKGHHLADVRGYAYEHRLVAEQNLGRRLLPGEIPHHINGIKTDNRAENIEVVASRAEHSTKHRKRTDLRRPREDNPTVQCACGCGEWFSRYDDLRRPRRFISGHNQRKGGGKDVG